MQHHATQAQQYTQTMMLNECIMAAAIHTDAKTIRSLSWEQIATATTSDPYME